MEKDSFYPLKLRTVSWKGILKVSYIFVGPQFSLDSFNGKGAALSTSGAGTIGHPHAEKDFGSLVCIMYKN